MFDNVGGKIKVIAVVFFWILAVASGISFLILLFSDGGRNFLIGLITGVGGILSAWIGSLFLYGFGELVESVEATRYSTHETEKSSVVNSKLLREILESMPQGIPAPSANNKASSDNELPPM